MRSACPLGPQGSSQWWPVAASSMEAVPLEVPLSLSLKTEKCNDEVSWDVYESPVPNPMVSILDPKRFLLEVKIG